MEQINQFILLIGGAIAALGLIAITWVQKSMGFKLAWQLFRVKRDKTKILLKVWLPNGEPQFKVVPATEIIEYTYKENGKEKTGMVLNEQYTRYKLFGVSCIEAVPHDIAARNPFLNTSLSVSGQRLKKMAIDASKDDFSAVAMYKKYAGILLPIAIVIMAGIVLYGDSQSAALAACYEQVGQIATSIPRNATIIAQ